MSLSSISQSQQDRLRHIELRLRFLGEVRRPEVMHRFGIQSAAASRDWAVYRELAPTNIEFDSRSKGYLLGTGFSALFTTSADQVLAWLAEQLGDTVAPSPESLLPCVMPSRLSSP
ncbi:hypothetical protein, partial [Acinetobacter baumannii]|uniref:hypothetical protein n=1 Tax=Acinetobacter baumannii TaxID=470 RepID=UPI003CC79DBD|nr:WYL domain-containing protein [Acinetobacter baumannii]